MYGLPENFIYNVGGDKPFLRRLVSTFLSPLASGYLFVVALLLAFRSRRAVVALSVLAAAGLLWTFSRSSLVALAAGLVVLAAVERRPAALSRQSLVIAVAIGWAHLFPKIGPTGRFTHVDITYQHKQSERTGRRLLRGESRRAVAPLALARPEGGRAHDDPSPAGLRARQRRADRLAHRHAAEGR